MITKLMAAAGLVLALAACTGPPPPAHTDAFTGLYNQSAATVPTDAPVTLQQPVGLIFSDNVEAYIGFVKDANEYWGARVPASLTNTVVLADNDPMYFAGRVLAMLKRHFPSAQRVSDFKQAVASGKKGVIVVDLRTKIAEPYGDRTTKYDIDLYFFNSAMDPVSKITGHGEYYVPYASATGGVQKSIDAAVQQLDGKITALVR
jgi:hypothetical protein